ncbi:MAG: DUF6198 family protein [Clostridiales bacterium]|jgi:hypothetical protein|nr:DUF6198 family protein [Clostridiales bacterium]
MAKTNKKSVGSPTPPQRAVNTRPTFRGQSSLYDAGESAEMIEALDAFILPDGEKINLPDNREGTVNLPPLQAAYYGTYYYGGVKVSESPKQKPKPKIFTLIKHKPVIYNELALIFALVFLAAGKVFMIKADFGVTAVQSVPLLLSMYFDKISLGTWNLIIQGIYVLAAVFLTHKFKWRYLLAIGIALVYVFILDLFMGWAADFAVTAMNDRILSFGIGFFLSALSMTFFFRCHVPLLPFETMEKELAEKTKKFGLNKNSLSILFIKVPLDIVFILISAGLSLLLFGKIRVEALGIGTVILLFTMSLAIGIITFVLNIFFDFRCIFDKTEKAYGEIADY